MAEAPVQAEDTAPAEADGGAGQWIGVVALFDFPGVQVRPSSESGAPPLYVRIMSGLSTVGAMVTSRRTARVHPISCLPRTHAQPPYALGVSVPTHAHAHAHTQDGDLPFAEGDTFEVRYVAWLEWLSGVVVACPRAIRRWWPAGLWSLV